MFILLQARVTIHCNHMVLDMCPCFHKYLISSYLFNSSVRHLSCYILINVWLVQCLWIIQLMSQWVYNVSHNIICMLLIYWWDFVMVLHVCVRMYNENPYYILSPNIFKISHLFIIQNITDVYSAPRLLLDMLRRPFTHGWL